MVGIHSYQLDYYVQIGLQEDLQRRTGGLKQS